MSHNITLSDRIKELSRTEGSGPFTLDGAATGFSAFEDFYASGDAVFYAATDGTAYEVGSGQYRKDSLGAESITRFPFKSSNSNNVVSFTAGVKEVYVTYPGKYAVFTGSGIGAYEEPKASGLAFWESSQILNYDGNIVWDASSNFLGVSTATPQFPIDVGGSKQYSQIRASGFLDGGSGVLFAGGTTMDTGMTASGGRQLEPFIRNVLATDTNANELLALSGVVDQAIMLNTQVKGTIFAGPASGCGCDPTYPTFRYLTQADIPELQYIWQHNDDGPNQDGAIALYKESGVAKYDNEFVFKDDTDRLGINTASPNATLDVFGDVKISGAITSYLVTTSGKMNHLLFGETEDQTWNVAIGDVNTGGSSTKSIYVGSNAGYSSADSVTQQIGIGLRAGANTTSGTRCSFVGDQAGYQSTSCTQLDGIGRNAGWQATGCNYTTFIGGSAGYQASGLDQSLGIGSEAWAGARFSDHSEAVGYRAGYLAVELNYSEAIGYQAGLLASGDRNIFIGDNAGYKASGDYNVFIGSGAGYNLNTGSNNLEIVTSGTLSSDTVMKNLSNKININNVVHGDSSTKRLVIGNVALTDYTPNSTLEVKPQNATDVGFIVEGAASQTADLAQWRDVDDNVNVAHITADGSIKTSGTVSASGGILIRDLVPNVTDHVLYNDGGTLKFHGSAVGGGASTVVKFSDGQSATDTISSADTNYVSGVSGVEVRYRTAGTNNYFTIGASGLSGVLYDYTSDVSGVFRSDITAISTAGWSLQDGTTPQAADSIANNDIVSISGISGVETVYRAANQNMVISASGLSGVMQTQIDALGAGAGTVSAGSGLTMVGTKMHMDVNGSGQLEHLIFNGDQIRIGRDAGSHLDPLGMEYGFGEGSYWNAIGYQAGYQASGVSNVNFIGYQAGYQSSGIQSTVLLGQLAGYQTTGILGGVLIGPNAGRGSTFQGNASPVLIGAGPGGLSSDIGVEFIGIGTNAGTRSSGVSYSALLGYQAGYKASGVVNAIFAGRDAGLEASGITSSTFIGYQAGYEATNVSSSNYNGVWAGLSVNDHDSVNALGYSALKNSSDITNSTAIGSSAGVNTSGLLSVNMIGDLAGWQSINHTSVNIMGLQAGVSSSGCNNSNIIGSYAGHQSSGNLYANIIGTYAGAGTSGCSNSNMMGLAAGSGALNSEGIIAIGKEAAVSLSDSEESVFIGLNAGYQASGVTESVTIGDGAARSSEGWERVNAIGVAAGYGSSGVTKSNLMGEWAGYATSGTTFGDLIGYQAGYSSYNCDQTIMLGTQAGTLSSNSSYATMIGDNAGYGANTATESIFIGKRAGYQWGGTNSLIIKTNSDSTKSGAEWADSETNGVVDIAQVVRGISTGADTSVGTKVRTLRIGAAPSVAELTNVCLSVKAEQSADVVLKLIPATSQSSAQMESVTAGYDNTVITNTGRLAITVAETATKIGSSSEYTLYDANSQVISATEDGVMVLLKYGGNKYLVVSVDSLWYTNTNTGALVLLNTVI